MFFLGVFLIITMVLLGQTVILPRLLRTRKHRSATERVRAAPFMAIAADTREDYNQ